MFGLSKDERENAKLRASAVKLERWLNDFSTGKREMTPEVRQALAEAHRKHVR